MKMKKKRWEWKEVRPAMALIWRESWMTRSALECGTCGWLEEFGSVHPYTSIISQSTFLSVLLHQWPGDSVLYMCERMRGLFSLWQLPPFLHHQTLRRWTFVIKPKLIKIYKKFFPQLNISNEKMNISAQPLPNFTWKIISLHPTVDQHQTLCW